MKILEENLMVLASAGSGKTHTLSDRIIGLIASGVEPSELVALTFTKKAAGEFTEAVLNKLAGAAENEVKARNLEGSLELQGIDFQATLRKLTGQLPQLTLGTMDEFFARVVRAFQYELGVTGGRFELFVGEAAELAKDEILEKLLDGQLKGLTEEELLYTFRRATAGSEGTSVLNDFRGFISDWHQIYQTGQAQNYGPEGAAEVAISDWEKQKHGLIAKIERGLGEHAEIKPGQKKGVDKLIKGFREFQIGGGRPEGPEKILEDLAAAADGSGEIKVMFNKGFFLRGIVAEGFRDLVKLAARCEMAAAVERTKGIYLLIAAYDAAIGRELRNRGKLEFQDIKVLMGKWRYSEDARLQREAIDFRLDSRYQHWLLDEFQDTSADDWNGLSPLVNEAIADADSSVFIVGDKKQGIYAWRGGDVALFDEVIAANEGNLKVETMAESWRSCPEVLGVVNQICGDVATMGELFGGAVDQWEWQDHESAPPLSTPEKRGYGQVSVVASEEKAEEVIAQMRAIGIGEKKLTCGLLLNKNSEVKEWADTLREAGFHVVEEGVRQPAKDHPVGIMIWQLLRWLANPADSFASYTVKMSPLWVGLTERFQGKEDVIWEEMTKEIAAVGYFRTFGKYLYPLLSDWTEFGQRRALELLRALEGLDNEGITGAKEVAYRIENLGVSQSPGMAAVQVMTVHKAKGLGFDVVFLPEISAEKVPNLKYLKVLQGEKWVLDKVPTWARTAIPELAGAEETWSQKQKYEAMCKVYVALTRAKRGLYVYMDFRKKALEEGHPCVANWISKALALDLTEECQFQEGNPDWHEALPFIQEKSEELTGHSLGEAVIRRRRSTPSGEKGAVTYKRDFSGADPRRFGTQVHAAFERISWVGEEPLTFSDEAAPVKGILEKSFGAEGIRRIFTKPSEDTQLYREQRLEAIVEKSWMSGVIDRLHVHPGAGGEAVSVDVIDFKTDQVKTSRELRERYTQQMAAYRKALRQIYPSAEIHCLLISTYLAEVIRVEE